MIFIETCPTCNNNPIWNWIQSNLFRRYRTALRQSHRFLQLKRMSEAAKRATAISKNSIPENFLGRLSDYSLWHACRSIKRPVNWKPSLRTSQGRWARNNTGKGNIFVGHLKNVTCLVLLVPIEADELSSVDVRAAVPLLCCKILFEAPSMAQNMILFVFNVILCIEYFFTAKTNSSPNHQFDFRNKENIVQSTFLKHSIRYWIKA